jgi:hypothetical protein
MGGMSDDTRENVGLWNCRLKVEGVAKYHAVTSKKLTSKAAIN